MAPSPTRKQAYTFTFAAAILAGLVTGCAEQVGNLRGNIAMKSNTPQPARPEPPSRPVQFPPIQLLFARTNDPASSEIFRPGAVASLSATPADARVRARTSGSRSRTNVPVSGSSAPSSQTEWKAAAQRALDRVQNRDEDDTAILLSLREQLASSPELAPLRDEWDPLLLAGIERAEKLYKLSIELALLEQAFAGAELDPSTELYQGVDMPSCRKAFRMLFERNLELAELEVNVSQLRRMKLTEINELCEFSHQAELAVNTLPRNRGSRKLRNQVQRAYREAFPDHTLKKVVLPSKRWKTDKASGKKVMDAVLGVVRPNAFPDDPCIMQEVSIYRANRKKVECCDVRKETPVLCEALE